VVGDFSLILSVMALEHDFQWSGALRDDSRKASADVLQAFKAQGFGSIEQRMCRSTPEQINDSTRHAISKLEDVGYGHRSKSLLNGIGKSLI
jgi:hypothetical protein